MSIRFNSHNKNESCSSSTIVSLVYGLLDPQ